MLYRSIVLFVVDFGCGETKYTKLYRKDYITTVSCSEYRYEAVKILVSKLNVLSKPGEKACFRGTGGIFVRCQFSFFQRRQHIFVVQVIAATNP